MEHERKELLAQKRAQLKIKQKRAEIQQYKDRLTKSIEHFSQKYRYADEAEALKLKPLSQNSILSNRGSWRSKKFAHIPMEMPTCAF